MTAQNFNRDHEKSGDGPLRTGATTGYGHYCRACASQGHTCCQGHDIYVTRGDCSRIADHCGEHAFFEYRGCSRTAYADQDDDPLWRQYVFRHDGSRRVLKCRSDGDCHFLGIHGCALPLSTRPLVCRLYPHLYSADGIADGWDGECPAAQTQAGPLIEQGIAGVQRQQAVQWHRLLYTEILWEAEINENRFNL